MKGTFVQYFIKIGQLVKKIHFFYITYKKNNFPEPSRFWGGKSRDRAGNREAKKGREPGRDPSLSLVVTCDWLAVYLRTASQKRFG